MRHARQEVDMKLFYVPGDGSLSPHIVLREAGLRFDLERVDLTTHRTASGADFLALNPMGEVPVLQLGGPGAAVLTDISAILQYLGDRAPEAHLVPAGGTRARCDLQARLDFIARDLHPQLGSLLHGRLPAAVAARRRGEVGARFLRLQDVLNDRAFLMGETFTVADAYLFVMLRWGGLLGIDLGLYPNLEDYAHRIAERPAVAGALAAEGLVERGRLRRSA
jgi:glutathione S-transferase